MKTKCQVHSRYNQPGFAQSISDCHSLLRSPNTRILLDSRNLVGAVRMNFSDRTTKEIVIKEYRLRGINLLKSAFLPSKALKAWRASNTLIEKKIETPFPVAYFEKRKGAFIYQSFFLAEFIHEVGEIRYLFFSLQPEKLQKLLIHLAPFLFRCHDSGILHRDLSDGNILVKTINAGYYFCFIDTNRIRVKKRIGTFKRAKNLIRLGIPAAHQRFFLEQYFNTNRINGFVWFWYRLNKKVLSGYIELKKRLKLREISQKLKIQ